MKEPTKINEVKKSENQEFLEKIAKDKVEYPAVRRFAVGKINNGEILKKIIQDKRDVPCVRNTAILNENVCDLDFIKKALSGEQEKMVVKALEEKIRDLENRGLLVFIDKEDVGYGKKIIILFSKENEEIGAISCPKEGEFRYYPDSERIRKNMKNKGIKPRKEFSPLVKNLLETLFKDIYQVKINPEENKHFFDQMVKMIYENIDEKE